jgi:hypothetical protein
MATEIEQIEDKIITAIKTTVGIADCDTWSGGDIEELLPTVLSATAARVIYASGRHGDKKVIGANTNDREMLFRVALIVTNLRARKDGSRGAYQHIESLNGALKGLSCSPLPGYLWPVSDELLLIQGGKFVYGFEFERRTNR